MAEPTVAAGFASGLLSFAVRNGADRGGLLSAAGLTEADLADPDARIAFARYVSLMRAAKAATGDPALALHYGATVDISRVSIVGLIGQASETMLDAFAQLNRYVRLVVDLDEGPGDRFRLERDGSGLWFIDARAEPNAFPELTESAFAQFICAPRALGVPDFAKALRFTHESPPHRAEYERIFLAPVAFDCDRNGYLIDERWLHHRVGHLPRYVFGVLSEHADALLKTLEDSKTTRGRVERLLMPVLHTGEANMERVAGQLGMSRQTLFRRLKAESVTFETVLDDLRHRLALHYLQGKRATATETAYLVGFSEPAAFSRAFKRWTGASPSSVVAASDPR